MTPSRNGYLAKVSNKSEGRGRKSSDVHSFDLKRRGVRDQPSCRLKRAEMICAEQGSPLHRLVKSCKSVVVQGEESKKAHSEAPRQPFRSESDRHQLARLSYHQ